VPQSNLSAHEALEVEILQKLYEMLPKERQAVSRNVGSADMSSQLHRQELRQRLIQQLEQQIQEQNQNTESPTKQQFYKFEGRLQQQPMEINQDGASTNMTQTPQIPNGTWQQQQQQTQQQQQQQHQQHQQLRNSGMGRQPVMQQRDQQQPMMQQLQQQQQQQEHQQEQQPIMQPVMQQQMKIPFHGVHQHQQQQQFPFGGFVQGNHQQQRQIPQQHQHQQQQQQQPQLQPQPQVQPMQISGGNFQQQHQFQPFQQQQRVGTFPMQTGRFGQGNPQMMFGGSQQRMMDYGAFQHKQQHQQMSQPVNRKFAPFVPKSNVLPSEIANLLTPSLLKNLSNVPGIKVPQELKNQNASNGDHPPCLSDVGSLKWYIFSFSFGFIVDVDFRCVCFAHRIKTIKQKQQ